MALNKNVMVEMPAHCVRTKKNGAVYVQYTIRAYRNEKGKPTSERVSIGKEDPQTGMLIPNRNYYEYVEKRKQIELPAFIRSCGTYAAFSGVSKILGLKRLLENQSDEVAEGKMFAAFISLIVRTYMQNQLSAYMSEHKFTFQKILLELDKVKLIHSAHHENNCRLLNPPTKTQRDIMEHLSLDPTNFGCV